MRAARMHSYKQPLVLEGVAVPDKKFVCSARDRRE
jgi:hypothetical protein